MNKRILNHMPERVRSIYLDIVQENLTRHELTALALLLTLEAEHTNDRKPRIILIEGGKQDEVPAST